VNHNYRSIAEPAKCYIDGRIERLMSLVDSLAMIISTHVKDRWDEVV